MTAPLLLVTGFGPFLDVAANPSGEVARLLADAPPAGVEVAASVLPVDFDAAPAALDAALEELLPRTPCAILSLGVQRDAWFRLERRARSRLDSHKPDAQGRYARELGALSERDLECPLDLHPLLDAMLAAGATKVGLSIDAGGYVCERTFHAGLSAGARLSIPALFLHVPPVDELEAAAQLPIVRSLAAALVGATRKG